MYRIDLDTNDISKLKKRQFGDLKLREREHLQEWIAKNPEVLGEELLIIQKEFSGFNDTNERLDLLALDKDGELVIIENKLDDTGRDVVWQALKYTSYCSTLTTEQIVKIYQDYLIANSIDEEARGNIMDFIESDEDELFLNKKDQRIIFVANNYRKEVTSTVLWLLKHDIQVKCFRTIPYSMGHELLLQIEQIIPLPETQEYMIDMLEKDKEEKIKSKSAKERETKIIEFWSLLKEHLKSKGIDFLKNTPAKSNTWITFPAKGASFGYCIGNRSCRVELYFPNDTDKHKFNAIYNYKDEIEKRFGEPLIWEKLKVASKVKFEMHREERLFRPSNEDSKDELWEFWINWFADQMARFYDAVNPYWQKAQKDLK